MIPTYNCAGFLGDTLRSVLAQDPGPGVMQIEVIDDASTDDPEAVVLDVAGERVTFHRQAHNVGHIRNFATCLVRARGHLIHLLHGDDCVRVPFYQRMASHFDTSPEIGGAFCRSIYMDGGGHWTGLSPLEQRRSGILQGASAYLATEQRIMTPSMVVRRSVYEEVGGFDERLICSEDWEMWVRIASRYPIAYETEPLAIYRCHDISNTGRHVRNGAEPRHIRQCIDMFSEYLPADLASRVCRQAKSTYAKSALDKAASMLIARDRSACAAIARAALEMDSSPGTILYAAKLALGVVRRL